MVRTRDHEDKPGDSGHPPGLDTQTSCLPDDLEHHLRLLEASGLTSSSIPQADFVDRVLAVVSKCEGKLDTIQWNDGGHGIAVGIAQWNQRRGELPFLIERWSQADPEKYKEIFKGLAARMHDEQFVRKANITRDSEIGKGIAQMVQERSFHEVEIQLMREKVVKAIDVAHHYGHRSELFVAEVADIANQMGWKRTRQALKDSNVLHIKNETKAIEALRQTVQDKRVHGQARDQRLAEAFSPHKLV